MSAHEGHYEPIMRFVVTADNGGPLDSTAYVCGYEMGALDARLSAAKHHHLPAPEAMIHRENVPQADLVAMHYGMTMTERHMPLDDIDNADEVRAEWAHVVFKQAWEQLGEDVS